MSVDSISEIPQIPSPKQVLERKVFFPFEEFSVWTDAFNHLKVDKGEKPEVKMGDGNFIINLPQQPTLDQILEVTNEFIKQAKLR